MTSNVLTLVKTQNLVKIVSPMKIRFPKRLLVIGLLALGAFFLLPLCIGVWMPDLLFGQTRTIARASSNSGVKFELNQFWNNVDFYTTELRVVEPSGQEKTILVDGDASKAWRADLVVDEKKRTAYAVYVGGLRSQELTW